jgi:DnaA family protein
MANTPQLLLNLEHSRPDRFEDFVAGQNQTTVAAVLETLSRQGSGLFLHGPAGSGKTHLLNALCSKARAEGMQAFYVASRRMPDSAAEGVRDLRNFDLVCIDDIDHFAGNQSWEHAVFHCFNHLKQSGGRMVVSSRVALPDLPLELGDLRSRLAWDVQAGLLPLDDMDKLEVMSKRAMAAGVALPEEVQRYLIRHGKRDMKSLMDNLTQIIEAAFARKRRITVRLAAEILATGSSA